MIKAALFDMDGLMFDTERIYDKAWILAAKDYNIIVNHEIMGQMRGTNEAALKIKFKQIFGESVNFAEFYGKTNVIARKILSESVPHMPYLTQLLNFLKQSKIKMAVASSTNSKDVEQYVKRAGVLDYFDAIIGGDMVKNSKPHPEIFLKAAKALCVPVNECIALEDSHNGIKSAHAAGCVAVMVPDLMQVTDEIKPFCTKVAADLGQVIEIIKNLNSIVE